MTLIEGFRMINVTPPSNEDVSRFPERSTIDTCSVWNVLSFGAIAFLAVESSRRIFIIAEYVRYECLFKRRKARVDDSYEAMKVRLIQNITAERVFHRHSMTIEDLQEVSKLKEIRNVGMGELASMVLANKIRCGFTTDDGPARKLAKRVFPQIDIRTSSHLLGWLVYTRNLNEFEAENAIRDHQRVAGLSSNHKYLEACRRQALYLHAMNPSPG